MDLEIEVLFLSLVVFWFRLEFWKLGEEVLVIIFFDLSVVLRIEMLGLLVVGEVEVSDLVIEILFCRWCI